MEYYGDKGFRYKLAHFGDLVTIKSLKLLKILQCTTIAIFNAWMHIFSVKNNDKRWAIARRLSWPWHFFYIWFYKYLNKPKHKRLLTDEDGFHGITGNTGAGKSSFSMELAERDRHILGKSWYFNSDIEKPSYSPELKAHVRYHTILPFSKVWSNFKMHMQLNSKYYAAYCIDEMHRIFDYRQNRTTVYASLFEPFRDYAVVSRKHIKRLFGITQMDRLDIQLMHLVKYFHEPRIDIGFDYEDWLLETGLFRFKVLGWRVKSYTVENGDDLVLYKKWYLPNEFADMDNFNTYAYSDIYNHLPMHQPNTSQGAHICK